MAALDEAWKRAENAAGQWPFDIEHIQLNFNEWMRRTSGKL